MIVGPTFGVVVVDVPVIGARGVEQKSSGSASGRRSRNQATQEERSGSVAEDRLSSRGLPVRSAD